MHEFSLVQGLLEQLTKLAAKHGAERILRVNVEIGHFSGIVVDSFRFGFAALAPLTPLTKDAELVVMSSPWRRHCRLCGVEQVGADAARPESCACCGSEDFSSSGGDDIILRRVEME